MDQLAIKDFIIAFIIHDILRLLVETKEKSEIIANQKVELKVHHEHIRHILTLKDVE